MRDQLVDAVRAARADADVRALLITGTGDAFCAGMDLGASTVAQAGRRRLRHRGRRPRRCASACRRSSASCGSSTSRRWRRSTASRSAPAPTSRSRATSCSCTTRPRFLWSFHRWGLVVDAGGAYLLPRLVGLPRAKAMVMLGEGCTGAEAVDLGLAYRCVEPDELEAEASALAARLAAGPTRALGLSKRLLNASFETDLARLARPRGRVPVARDDVGRPRRGHGRVQGTARPPVHGAVDVQLAWGPDEEAFRAELAAFLDEHVPHEADAGFDYADSGEREDSDLIPAWSRAWQATLFDHGWMIPAYPPELGGRNCTPVQTLIYLEEMARRRVPGRCTSPGTPSSLRASSSSGATSSASSCRPRSAATRSGASA